MPTREFPQLWPKCKQGHSPNPHPREDDGRQGTKLDGKPSKGSTAQQEHMPTLHNTDQHTQAELEQLFRVSRKTVYRYVQQPSTRK